jgi:hypothetical protein
MGCEPIESHRSTHIVAGIHHNSIAYPAGNNTEPVGYYNRVVPRAEEEASGIREVEEPWQPAEVWNVRNRKTSGIALIALNQKADDVLPYCV